MPAIFLTWTKAHLIHASVSRLKAPQALKEAGGTTFAEYVLAARIEQAKTWLRETDWSIDDIAEKLHYSNAQNFSRTFKKIVAVPPGHFRKEHRM